LDEGRKKKGSVGEIVDELLLLPSHDTEHVCADCGDAIVYIDEVYLLQVVRPHLYNGRTLHYQVIDETDVEGGFLFDPYYYCIKCWETLFEKIRSDMSDELPVEDADSKFECVCCSSGIREMELVGIATLGEFHVSKRAPSGIRGPMFTPISNTDMLCIYCLTILNDGYIDIWPELSENSECTDCIQARCWRVGQCGCRCHYDPEEEEEEEQPVVPYAFT
jgi:hypothetical protein